MVNKIRKIFSIALLSVFLFYAQTFVFAQSSPTLFTSEQSAHQYCPTDRVVWLNLPTGVYHFKGQRWYGNTKSGAYVCEQEADQAGDRATRNGQ